MKTLVEGLERYEQQTREKYRDRFAALADGQAPLAMLITCADSRLVPNLVASAEPGELFIVRNVANLVPAAREDGDEAEHCSVTAAVWYALEVLGVRNVVVCGHSGCGGMKAALAPEPPPSPALRRWLALASGSVETWRTKGPLDSTLAEHDQLSQIATRQQVANLETHSFVRERVARGDVRLYAWWFDIGAGRMLAYSEKDGRYVPAVEVVGEPELRVA
ncbi:MAG: carbonic anhydrase [Labilithrix sp.]|nr:carbonic anhydrase [Labilithrix sp.]